MENNIAVTTAKIKENPYETAPCREDGEIFSEGQQETKDGTCRCRANPQGCCVVGPMATILPRRLKKQTTNI